MISGGYQIDDILMHVNQKSNCFVKSGYNYSLYINNISALIDEFGKRDIELAQIVGKNRANMQGIVL